MRLVTTELLHPAEQSLEYYRVGRAAESPCVDRHLEPQCTAIVSPLFAGCRYESQVFAKRFPGVEGSLYFVGGFGVNYVQRDGIALAPVRFGVGWRQGIALSYMNFSRERRYNPL